jgi:hypothetical protein
MGWILIYSFVQHQIITAMQIWTFTIMNKNPILWSNFNLEIVLKPWPLDWIFNFYAVKNNLNRMKSLVSK